MADSLPQCRAPFASDAEVAALTAGFLARTLPAKAWTNDAHWAVAVDLTMNHPDFDGPRDMPGAISTYNVASGNENTDTAGYHETITQASLVMVRHALKTGRPGRATHEVVNDLMASPLGRTDWLLAHWSKDVLMSVTARRAYVPPDIKPLPVV
jgi:hypothetical protein